MLSYIGIINEYNGYMLSNFLSKVKVKFLPYYLASLVVVFYY